MLSACCRRLSLHHTRAKLSHTHSRAKSSFSLLIDIDGVLTRGSNTIRSAYNGIQSLVDPHTHQFTVPVVFLTNGSDVSEANKAAMLSVRLGVDITEDQVVLVNSPLRTFESWHGKSVLFSGQGDVGGLARSLGFAKPTTTSELLSDLPMLDIVDHRKRPDMGKGVLPKALPDYVPFEGVVITNTPIEWEIQTQVILDVLMTGGGLQDFSDTPLPLLACNPDLVWAAEYHHPRLANGAFVHSLSALYTELTGQTLDVTWCGKPTQVTYDYAIKALQAQADTLGVELGQVYGVGDNVDVDIVGANNAGVQSVLVCSGLYKNSEVVLERGMRVKSKLASRQSDIFCDYIAKDIGVFIHHLMEGY